jgi:hypothetical protein
LPLPDADSQINDAHHPRPQVGRLVASVRDQSEWLVASARALQADHKAHLDDSDAAQADAEIACARQQPIMRCFI